MSNINHEAVNRRVLLLDIRHAICKRYGLTLRELDSESRARKYAWPRQLGMALSRELTNRSTTAIGRRYGNRDHTTVIHAVRSVNIRLRDSALWAEHYAELRAQITAISLRAPKQPETA